MRAIPSVLFLTFCTVASTQPSEPVTSTTTYDRSAIATVTVHNGGSSALVAFNFIYTLHRDPEGKGATYGASTGYYDSLTDPGFARPIPPGQDMVLPFRFGGGGMYAKVTVAASLFADGSSYGEKGTIQKILDRRNYMLVSLNKSIGELTQAAKDGATREQVTVQFQMALNQEMSAGLDQDLNQCIQTVRGYVLAQLRNARAADGSIAPTDTILQSIIDNLKARRDLLKK